MADVNANIGVNIDTSEALAQLKTLQRQISQFHTSIVKSSETAALAQKSLTTNLVNSINSIGAFSAELRTVKSTAESFTDSLEKNKFSMREYFRYAGGATKTFGKLFRSEFETISNVAEERVKRLQTQYIKLGRDTNGVMKAIAVIPKELNMDDYATKVQVAAQRQALFNQLMKQGSTNLINFGKNTQWAGRQLMVGFTIPLSILGSTATRVFMDMETQAIKFKKVYGDLFTNKEETQQALDDIKSLAGMFTQYGVAVSQTVGLAAEAAAAGFSGIDLQRQTAEATRLSVLGQIDSQKALETTISLQNAFKISSADLANQINFLNAVENQTVVSLDDITTAIPKVAPVIQQLGGDVKDLAFFMAAMKEGGVNASEGANALKSGLAALINPTKRASDMLAGMGINITKIIETNKGNLKNTVIDFAKALDTLDPLTRARAIEQLFGKFQFARLSTLFDNVTTQGNQASRVLELANTSIEDLAALSEQELGISASSSMNKFKKALEDLKAALVPVGQTFLDAITPIINFVGGILEKFNDLSAGTKKVITILTVGLGAVGPVLLMTFGLLANGIGNLIKLFLTLRNGYLRLTGQSQILGEQTQYMTNEQLEAAAASHSLDQSHAKLTQTFTAETGAINQLISAYQRAAQAAQNFAISNPGSMSPIRPKKLADGIVSVPGPKGAGDIVPAMLSPGEAVIPAPMAKKYGGLINGMIADNIPGYQGGLGTKKARDVGSGSAGRIGKSSMAVMRPYTANVSNSGGLVSFTDIDPSNFTDVASLYAKEVLQQAGISIKAIDTEIKQWEVANKAAIDIATNAVNQGASAQESFGPLMAKFTTDMETAQGPFNKFTITAKEMMPKLQEDLIMAQTAAKNLGLNIKNAAEAVQLSEALPGNMVAGGAASSGSFTSLRRVRGGIAASAGAEGVGQYGIPRFMISPTTQTSDIAYKMATSQEHFSTTLAQEQNLAALRAKRQSQNFENGKRDAQAYEEGRKSAGNKDIYEETRKRNSPHPMARKDGLDDAKAYQSGRSSGLVDQYGKPLSSLTQNATTTQGQIQNTQSYQKMQIFNERLSKINNAIMGGTFALTTFAGMASMSGGALGNISQQIFKYSGILFALMSVTQLITQAKLAELAATRANTVAMAMGSSTGLKGLFTSGGGIASFGKNILTAGKFALRFAGPIGLATTALTVAVGLYRWNNKRLQENSKQLEAFGNAIKTSKNQLKATGDYFGVVPTTTGLENTTQEKLVSNPVREEINKFKESDTFKEYRDTVDAVSRLSSADATLALQTKGTELLGKGFTKEQVNVIVTAIQEEAGKTDLKINFKSVDFEQLNSDIQTGLGDKLKALPQFINDTMRKEMTMNERGQWVSTLVMGPEAKAEIKNQGQALKAYFNGLSGMIQNGTISFAQFNQSFTNMGNVIKQNVPDTSQQIAILNSSLEQMDARLAKAAIGVQGFESKLLLAKAAAIGLNLEVTNAMLNALVMGSLPGATAEDMIRASTVSAEIEKMIAIRDKAIKALNKPVGTRTGGNGEKSWLQKLQDMVKATKLQTQAFYDMRKAGIEAGVAMELASNPEMAKGIAAAAKAGGKAWKDALNAIKQYKAAQQELALAEVAAMNQGDYELQRLNKAQAYIDLQSHFIDMRYSSQLEFIDKSQEENDLLLQRIAYQETLINNRYNPIIDRLQKIEDLNKSIADIESRRLDVVSALSSGDIAGGVKAMSELRAARMAQTSQSQINNLNAARDREISMLKQNNLTKEQIDLQNQKLTLDKREIESIVAKEKATLSYFGMTKRQIDNAAKALDLAKTAGLDINDPAFLNNILQAAIDKTLSLESAMKDAAKAMKALFDMQEEARKTKIEEPTLTSTGNKQFYETYNKGVKITTPWDTGASTKMGTTYSTTSQSNVGLGAGNTGFDKYQSNNPFVPIPQIIGTVSEATKKFLGTAWGFSSGGMVPKYFASGGYTRGKDNIPAMLSAGEYVVQKSAVDAIGIGNMASINKGTLPNNSVYNYSLSVNVGGSSQSANDIARIVMSEIKKVDAQRVRGIK